MLVRNLTTGLTHEINNEDVLRTLSCDSNYEIMEENATETEAKGKGKPVARGRGKKATEKEG